MKTNLKIRNKKPEEKFINTYGYLYCELVICGALIMGTV